MKNLLRSWAVRGLLICSLLAAPWAALAAFNIAQNDNGSTGFLSTIAASGVQAMTFFNTGAISRTASVNGTGVVTWAFDEKEYAIQFADLGTLSDAGFVVPETGVIQEISLAWNLTLTGSNAVLTATRIAQGGVFAGPTAISAVSLTAPTSAVGGGKVTDDIIFQAVGRGDLITLQTDGGPSNVVPGWVVIRIRAPAI